MIPIQRNPYQTVMRFSLLTAFSLAGGLALAFTTGNVLFASLNVNVSGFGSGLLALPLVLLGIFGGGALWGYGVARLTGADKLALARSGAVTFGGVVLVMGIILEMLFGLIGFLAGSRPIPLHTAFTLVFVPSAGLIATLSTARILRSLRARLPVRRIAWTSGMAASLGFLLVNLMMQSQGWIVGAPGAAERFTMITVMLTGNVGAALSGGAVLGWMPRKIQHE